MRELAATDGVADINNCMIVHVEKRGKQVTVPHIAGTFIVLHIAVLHKVLMI